MKTWMRITSRIDGFRRGGISHPGTETFHDPEAFSEDQVTAIQNEPNLVAEMVELDHDPRIPAAVAKAEPAKPDAGAKAGADTGKKAAADAKAKADADGKTRADADGKTGADADKKTGTDAATKTKADRLPGK